MNQIDTTSVSGDPEYLPVNSPDSNWQSVDLGCSAAVIAAGYKLTALDRSNPDRVQFLIRRDEGLDRAVERYWSGELLVSARHYFDTLRMLKNRLHSAA